jgi:hypothetical protein
MSWPLIREHVVMGMAGGIIGGLLAMQTSSAPEPSYPEVEPIVVIVNTSSTI